MTNVRVERDGSVTVVTIERQERRNAVDPATATQLADAFRAFDASADSSVAVLTGAGGTFCAGFDLRAIAAGDVRPIRDEGDGPMGPTRMRLSKPVIAAVEGYAVAGGLELALWCDLRVAAEDAVFGVFSRRFGVPFVDMVTVRLPRLIGQSRALDMLLTGRAVEGHEAHAMGLVNRLVLPGDALGAAVRLAHDLAAFPQTCLRGDRLSAIEQWDLTEDDAMRGEVRHGMEAIASGEMLLGAQRFARGAGRHGFPAASDPPGSTSGAGSRR
jgi:enoyl-CoA hydratase